jgi:hypothetical protein
MYSDSFWFILTTFIDGLFISPLVRVCIGAGFADQFPLFRTSSLDMFIRREKNDIDDAHRVLK